MRERLRTRFGFSKKSSSRRNSVRVRESGRPARVTS
jgi:hypothetical protein